MDKDKDEFGAPIIAERTSFGLTKREWFAGMALKGLLASWGNHDLTSMEDIAHDAILAAD